MRTPLVFQAIQRIAGILAAVCAVTMGGPVACGRAAPEASASLAATPAPSIVDSRADSSRADSKAAPASSPGTSTGPGASPASTAALPVSPAATLRTGIGAPLLPMDEAAVAARHQRARERTLAATQAGAPARYLSHLASIPPYDRAAFIADPEDYLSEAVPARALRDAEPGTGAPELLLEGRGLHPVVVGQPVTIRVRARPGAPVSFFSSDLALADNGLAAITVQADANGQATARYTAHPGAIDDAHISIASPECIGVLRVTLTVAHPVSER